MPRITHLRQQAGRRRGLVTVYLDDEPALELDLDLAASLRIGQDLSEDSIEALRDDGQYQRALGRALQFLGYRARSQAEVEAKLAEWEVAQRTAGRVLTRLRQLRLLDDAAFAAWWVESRGRQAPRGRIALGQELRRKGLDETLIRESLAEIDEDAQALQLALARAPRLAALPRADFERRLGGLLARRGFGGDAARRALRLAWEGLQAAVEDQEQDCGT